MAHDTARRDVLKSASGLFLTLAAGSVGSAVAAAQAHPRPAGGTATRAAFAPVEAALKAAVRDQVVANVVAVGADKTGIVYEGAVGSADASTGGAPVSVDSVFWMLSMTKAITAAACMQLIEQGKLRLDQPAGEILPQLKTPLVLTGFDAAGRPTLRPARRAVTLRHLLTHTSGFTYPVWSADILRYERATGMPDIAYSMNGAFGAPLEFEPGERWEYGIGMDWVGKLIEAVTGQSLEIYFRENIFAPLGMRNSGFLMSSAQKRRVTTMVQRQADGSLKAASFEMNQRPEFFSGGGGLFSTPRDYMSFLQMLACGGSLHGVRVLKPATVASMFENHIGALDVVEMKSVQPAYSTSFDQFPGMPHKWGLSFDINTSAGPHGRSAGSGGWAGLLNTYFWIDPARQVTGAMFTQLLPFFDERVVALWGQVEEGIYRGIGRA
jgi:methyl acetate hydrolase